MSEYTDAQIIEVMNNLQSEHKHILRLMSDYPIKIDSRIWILSDPPQALTYEILKILKLQGLVDFQSNQYSLTNLGKEVVRDLKGLRINLDNKISFEASEWNSQRAEKFKKICDFLELYKQGSSYKDIADKYSISRERVRQILYRHPDFERYKCEQKEEKLKSKETKIISEKSKTEKDLYERSIGFLYPEKVSELWDYQKNGDLEPYKILSGNTTVEIWLRCSNGHGWKKKVKDITTIWRRNETSGCPVCAGKSKKVQKQPILIDAYPDLVNQYWNFEKNQALNLDPKIITCGSNKKAWFKCPHDDNEWQVQIVSLINQQWSKDNPGCSICNGTEDRKKGTWQRQPFLGIEFPEQVEKYWFYEANNKLGLDPMKLTTKSSKEAFFKCPIDGYEWVTTIKVIEISWKKGNSGCARCGSRWTIEAIRQFVASLEEYIPDLTPAERYKIFEQSGVLNTGNQENLKIVKDIIKGKLSVKKLGKSLKREESQDIQLESNDIINPDDELQVIDGDTSQHTFHDKDESIDHELDSEEEKNSQDNLPKVSIQKSLEFLNSQVVASADQEAIEFFIASRRNRIWAEIFEDESAIEVLEEFEESTDEGYGRRVRDEFLDQYYQAKNMKIPDDWSFHINGKIVPPNLMQKLAAVLLRKQKRMLNLSLTGTGKTIGGILSSRIIDARLTVIICPLDTIENWHSEIKNVFPNSKVTTRNFNPYWENIDEVHHYIILNHEKFQQPTTASNIRQLVERFPIDLIIVDEIHKCKQRTEDQSKRRQMVMGLITNANQINPNLHVLGMSATPIINNLREGKSLVELVSGLDRSDLGEKATTNNCMKLHQTFVTLGIRSKVKPKIVVDRISIPIDCSELVDEIREKGTSVLKMEQILTQARIPIIIKELKPKTIVYTHFVEGITHQLKEAIEAAGWTVGFHLGGNKSGFNRLVAK